jgi:hypothetical protein
MSHANDSDQPVTPTDGGVAVSRTHRSRKPMITTGALLAVLSAAVLAPHALPATAATGGRQLSVAAAVPPAGSAWIQGVLTDQAGHPVDNVNVEVWSDDPSAAGPIASNLTYGGTPADGRHAHGVYRVEVPMDQPYSIVFSAVGGAEDGDAFRMQTYGQGRPIMVRSTTRTRGVSAAAGTIRKLGRTELARQGKVRSTVKAKVHPAKGAAKRGTLLVKVKSPYVSPVTGKVIVKVNGKKVTNHLGKNEHGKSTLKLPKLTKAGKYKVHVHFAGTGTVARSKTKPIKLTVK